MCFTILHQETQQCKKKRNTIQMLFSWDGGLQHLNCIVSIQVSKQYSIGATNVHGKLEILSSLTNVNAF
jgi:hypothetical protein